MKKIKLIIVFTIILTLGLTLFNESEPFITGISNDLKLGSRGSEVEQVQQGLKNYGYYSADIDGCYGWKTFMAVRDFQQNHGLTPDGIAGRDTLETMGLTTLAQTGVAYAQGSSIPNAQLLARAINGEARGEEYMGQVAVGAVILNRTRDPRFPKTIAGVIYQPGAFTAVSDGQINVDLKDQSILKAANDALNGWDPTNGCVYYWNPATATSKWIWSKTIVKKIGKHYFGK